MLFTSICLGWSKCWWPWYPWAGFDQQIPVGSFQSSWQENSWLSVPLRNLIDMTPRPGRHRFCMTVAPTGWCGCGRHPVEETRVTGARRCCNRMGSVWKSVAPLCHGWKIMENPHLQKGSRFVDIICKWNDGVAIALLDHVRLPVDPVCMLLFLVISQLEATNMLMFEQTWIV